MGRTNTVIVYSIYCILLSRNISFVVNVQIVHVLYSFSTKRQWCNARWFAAIKVGVKNFTKMFFQSFNLTTYLKPALNYYVVWMQLKSLLWLKRPTATTHRHLTHLFCLSWWTDCSMSLVQRVVLVLHAWVHSTCAATAKHIREILRIVSHLPVSTVLSAAFSLLPKATTCSSSLHHMSCYSCKTM